MSWEYLQPSVSDRSRTCSFYVVGPDEHTLQAYDEYHLGSGVYWTRDLLLVNRYTCSNAIADAAQTPNANVYYAEIQATGAGYRITVNLMYDHEEVKSEYANITRLSTEPVLQASQSCPLSDEPSTS